MAMPRSAGGRSLTSSPSNISLPEVTSSSPATRRSRVDLPQPDGPTNTTNSLFLMSRSTPLITSTWPNDFFTCRIVMSAIVASRVPLPISSDHRATPPLLHGLPCFVPAAVSGQARSTRCESIRPTGQGAVHRPR